MIIPDVALAMLVNRTAQAYTSGTPAYMTYRETTRISAPSMGRTQEIDRSVAVRVADNYAVMRDLPDGGERTGEAFPIIAQFNPFSAYQFSYFANLKNVEIHLERGASATFPIPAPDPGVDVLVPYNSFWAARYAPDSTEQHLHLLVDPTARVGPGFYPSEVIEDPQTQLPSHVEIRTSNSDMVIALDYQVIQGHWVLTHGRFSATEHVIVSTFKVIADVTYDDFAFPAQAPDPRLAGTPVPTVTP